jgi:branched-chain amino acid transport system ATP-binding protein
MALSVSDYAYVIAEGRIALSGPAGQVAQEEHVRKAYLGV